MSNKKLILDYFDKYKKGENASKKQAQSDRSSELSSKRKGGDNENKPLVKKEQ